MFSCHFEEQWISDCPIDYKPVSYRWYIDDTFLLFLSELHVDNFLNYMNCKHRSINFTVECEEYNSPSFLDINIFCGSEKFHRSVYRKHKFGGILINLESFLLISYKYNLIFTLLHRGFMICPSYRTLHFENLELKQDFFGNPPKYC